MSAKPTYTKVFTSLEADSPNSVWGNEWDLLGLFCYVTRGSVLLNDQRWKISFVAHNLAQLGLSSPERSVVSRSTYVSTFFVRQLPAKNLPAYPIVGVVSDLLFPIYWEWDSLHCPPFTEMSEWDIFARFALLFGIRYCTNNNCNETLNWAKIALIGKLKLSFIHSITLLLVSQVILYSGESLITCRPPPEMACIYCNGGVWKIQ